MTLAQLAVLGGLALLTRLFPRQGQTWWLLLVSLLSLYALQPALTLRRLDFMLPTVAICLSCWVWRMTQKPQPEDKFTLFLALAVMIGAALTRYIGDLGWAIRPPAPFFWLPLIVVMLVGLSWWRGRAWELNALIFLTVCGLIGLKSPVLAENFSRVWRGWQGQSLALARAEEIQWLGISYLAFRWLHLLRDRQLGILPPATLRETLLYSLFFPALVAGPLDRLENFLRQLAAPLPPDQILTACGRIALGLGKKFVLADSLALLALQPDHLSQLESPLGTWLVVYGYALRLWLDFSGYSDMAIGLGLLAGMRLPENFHHPYLQTNITAFWQSWHITLSDWVRFYIFSPLSRMLLRRKPAFSFFPYYVESVVFFSLLTTLLVMGFWHGITWNFFLWGLWQGVGLFIHRVWTRVYPAGLPSGLGWFLTFHYIALGWVWFAYATPAESLLIFGQLFNLKWWGL